MLTRALIASAALTLVWLTSVDRARADAGDARLDIYWTDVEGGAATLIVTPAGESVLIDTGLPGERDPYRIARTVTQMARLDHIDHLIVTHFDVDHFGGAADLAQRVQIDQVWDPGLPTFAKGDRRLELLRRYRRIFGRKRQVLKPGDVIPLKRQPGRGAKKLDLVCFGAARKFIDAPDGATENDVCGRLVREKKKDTSENGESTALLLRFGKFEFLDCGDLTWNQERRLVCPVNLVGKVDVFQVNHHGLDSSNNPVLVESVEPRVAIMNNGARKGCMPEVFRTLTGAASIAAIYQMHRNVRVGPAGNTAPELIANDRQSCDAEIIKLSVAPDAVHYSIEIPASGHRRVFKTKMD